MTFINTGIIEKIIAVLGIVILFSVSSTTSALPVLFNLPTSGLHTVEPSITTIYLAVTLSVLMVTLLYCAMFFLLYHLFFTKEIRNKKIIEWFLAYCVISLSMALLSTFTDSAYLHSIWHAGGFMLIQSVVDLNTTSLFMINLSSLSVIYLVIRLFSRSRS